MKILEPITGRTIDIVERSSKAVAQRRWMALLAAMFPVVFLVSSFLLGRTDFQPSISDYYATLDFERNIFVGILCFVASYLILYQGYTWLEDRVLDVAGFSAVGIALFPVSDKPGISAHYIFAIAFFSCIFYVCIYMSRKTLSVTDPDQINFFRWSYRACASVMVGIIVFAIIMSLLPENFKKVFHENHVIFWMEAFGIWAFSAFWYIKSRELDSSLSFVPFFKRRKL